MFLAIAVLALTANPAASFESRQHGNTYRPLLAFGSSPVINQAVQKVAKLTETGDFAAAKLALRLLPAANVKVEWDDSQVPKSSQFDFNHVRDTVLQEWAVQVRLVKFTIVKTGADLRVSFVEGSGESLVWSEDPTQPRLTARIGLKQGNGQVDPSAVYNDVSFAMGSYCGITRLPLNGFVMSGNDAATQSLGLSPLEKGMAIPNLIACEKIRSQVANSEIVESGTPAIAQDPSPQNLGTVIQGTNILMKIPIKNSGTGLLIYKILPDCSCFAAAESAPLQPNHEIDHQVRMSTTEYTGVVQGGVLHHNLFLLSNDPSNPVRVIPVEVKVRPRYRFLPNPHVLIANDQGDATVTAYLWFPPDRPLQVTSAASHGLDGEVVYEPWEGKMADPDLGEGPLPRKGYKFTVKLKKIPEGGMMGTAIDVGTDDPQFDQVSYVVYAQRGILASPQSLFLGEIGGAPRTMFFLVSRPGKAFKITNLTTDSPHVRATYAPTKTEGEFQVSVTYDGKGEKGDLHATVIVKTDDPKQKEIDVPVLGTVR